MALAFCVAGAGVSAQQVSGTAFSANGDTAFTPGQGSVVIPVLENDTPQLGGTLAITGVTQGVDGTVLIDSDGTIIYTPSKGFKESDAFTYTVTDGLGNTATETVAVENGFDAAAGTYAGLITNGTAPSNSNSGYITATLTDGGKLSGKLFLGGIGYAVKGHFDLNWNCLLFINRPKQTAYAVLHLDPGSQQITGTVSNGAFTSTATANRLPYSARIRPAPQAGKFTVLLPPAPTTTGSIPEGDGYLTMSIGNGGCVTAAGRLGDGTEISSGGVLVPGGCFPLYAGLKYPTRGSIVGLVLITGSGLATDTCSGTLMWFKPSQPAQPRGNYYYWNGFTTTTELIGSRYDKPLAGMPALNLTNGNGVVTLSDGNFDEPVSRTFNLSTTNKVTITDAPARDTLKLSFEVFPLTGAFKGSFFAVNGAHSVVKRTFGGVLLQNQVCGGGWFLGWNESGAVELGAQ